MLKTNHILTVIQTIIGFIGLIAIAIPFSESYKNINYKYIFIGILAQLILAVILIKVPFVIKGFDYLNEGVLVLQSATSEGASFVFGYPPPFEQTEPNLLATFAFGILPYIIVMACISAILWHWRVLPFIVNLISKACQKLFNIGAPVGLGAAANVFVGQVEAPLLIRPYVNKLSNKELLILMTAGMATVAGSVMIALIDILEVAFPDEILIQHFLTASLLSVPAAIMYANIMIPSNAITDFNEDNAPKVYRSTMDAVTKGTSDGASIAISVGTILIAVVALVYIINTFLGFIGSQIGFDLSIQIILGYIFAPIAWLMGIPWDDAILAGELLGLKTALNEFYAYPALASNEYASLSDRSKLITFYSIKNLHSALSFKNSYYKKN